MSIRKNNEVGSTDEVQERQSLPEELTCVKTEFIEENQHLVKSCVKKGGPYSKHERMKRQNEVYRLHFEHSYSSVKISEIMKINRHTIDDDIRLGYSKLAKEWKRDHVYGWFMKQINRLETQRARLLDDLDNQKDLDSKLSIEKIILEIDNKITQILVNSQNRDQAIMMNALGFLNRWAKDKKLDVRFLDRWDIFHTSKTKYAKIQEILQDEKS